MFKIHQVLLLVLPAVVACSGSEGTVANCGNLQQTCLDRGMCLVSTNSGTTGGSAGGSYGAGGVSANGSFSDSASCGFTCSECGDGGTKTTSGLSNNCIGSVGNNNTITINGNVCSPGGSTGDSSTGTTSSSGDGGSPTNSTPAPTGYKFQWYPCIDISAVPQYSNCSAYCKAQGAICGNYCERTVWSSPGTYTYGSKDASIQYACSANECATKLAGNTPAGADNCDGTQLFAGVSNSYANVCGTNQQWDVAQCCCGTQ
jgi:hypothetical protein